MAKRCKKYSYAEYLKATNARLQLLIDTNQCTEGQKLSYQSTIHKNQYTIRQRTTRTHTDNSCRIIP